MLTSVACVVRSNARLSALEDVHAVINSFIDASATVSLPKAASTGSTLLFQRVLERVSTSVDIDPLLKYHWLGKAMAAAIERGHMAIVLLIHDANPTSLAVRTFEIAAKYGQVEILQWLYEHRFDMLCIDVPPAQKELQKMRCCMTEQCEDTARMNRRIGVLRWLHDIGFNPSFRGAGDVAAMQGDLEMVQWLHEYNFPGAFTHAAIDAAVRNGHFEILQFLHEHGNESNSDELLMQAMARGYTAIAAYLREQKICTTVHPETLFVMAAEHGRLDLLQRMRGVTQDDWIREDALAVSIANGHLHVAQWLGPYPVESSTLSRAASDGHLPLLQWVHDEDCGGWDISIVHSAAIGGHLHVIQWLQHEYPTLVSESRCFELAAAEGHLSNVNWLQDHNHANTFYNVQQTAGNGHLAVIQWLQEFREGGSRLTRCESLALHSATYHGHLELAMWLRENGYNGPTTALMRSAPLDAATWAFQVLNVPIDETVVDAAVSRGDLAMLKWIYKHSNLRARGSHHPHLNDWIRENERGER